MKTPRQVLLSRHARASRSLDDIRNAALRELKSPLPMEVEQFSVSTGLLRLIRDLRWHLWPMAAVWVLALFLQLSAGSGPSPSQAHSAAPQQKNVLLSARENRLQLMELIEPNTHSAPPVQNPMRRRTQSDASAISVRSC